MGSAADDQLTRTLADLARDASRLPALRPILSASTREILRIAAGRGEHLRDDAAVIGARAYVRIELLAPAADCYALLGVPRHATAAAVKEHYRLLMRLLHPDYSQASSEHWPADAPSRINLAYETLSLPERRRKYDSQLEAQRPSPAPRRPAPPARADPAKSARPVAFERSILKNLAAAFGIAGIAAGSAVALFGSGDDRDSLVQRPAPLSHDAPAPAASIAGRVAAPVEAAARELWATLGPAVRMEPAAASATSSPITTVAPPAAQVMEPAVRAAAATATPLVTLQIPAALPPGPVLEPVAVLPSLREPARREVAAIQPPPSPAPAAPSPPAPFPQPRSAAGPPAVAPLTIADAQPLISQVIEYIEAGGASRIDSLLESEARSAGGARTFVRLYVAAVGGSRAAKVRKMQFRSHPAPERLLVSGSLWLDASGTGPEGWKEIPLEAEFAVRRGSVVMTRLGPPE